MIPFPYSKLRRLTYSDAGEMSVDWASLDRGLVELIGWRVLAAGDLPDYVRFRAVCSHWRASTVRPRGRGVLDPRFHPRPWMMLPEGRHGLYPGHPHLAGFVRFFNLSTGAFLRAHLPLLDDHVILDSIDGLLLLHRDHDTAVRLLNPFTGDVADLPPLASLLPQIEEFTHDRFNEESKRTGLMSVLASVTVSSTGAITVMLAFNLLHRVAYATIGDQQRWTLFAWKIKPLIKPVSFQGKFYAMQLVRNNGVHKLHVYQINPPIQDAAEELSPLPVKIAECPVKKLLCFLNFVECCSELLLVAYNDASRSKLVIYRLADLVDGKFEPVTSIGNHTLFVGERCLCVSSSPNKGNNNLLSIMSPNSVICLHRLPVNHGSQDSSHFEQYDLGTGIWIPASDGNIFQRPPPSPHTLIHHIFTCCCRKYWNKGLMFCAETEPVWLVKQELRYGA